jgi:hypothetical protein
MKRRHKGLAIRTDVRNDRGMACMHPPEERQRVYEGRALPRNDRLLCGLCGELLYVGCGDGAAAMRAARAVRAERDPARAPLRHHAR